MRYLCILVIWIGLSLSTQSQNIFISSDGAIFMDMPTTWTIEEAEVGVVHLSQVERGVDIQLMYGDSLYMQLLQNDPQLDLDYLTPVRTAVLLAQTLEIEPLISIETAYNQDVYQYAHDDMENGTQSFVMESIFTGVTHVIVSGSYTPYEDFLQVWLAYETPAEPPFDCSQLTLEASQALPGAVLFVDGLPIGLNDFEFQAIADDVEDVMPLIAIAQEDVSYMTAPLYPDFRLEGGNVTIQAIHNGLVCKEFPFVVEPMPEASGEIGRYITAANRYIDATLDFLAIDRDDIMSSPVPDALLPVAEIQFMIDHPDNPDSLVNIIETAPDEEIRLIEALLANDGYVDYLNGFADFLLDQPPLPPVGTAAHELYLSTSIKPWEINEFNIARKIDIPDASRLSYFMQFQQYWATFSQKIGDYVGAVGLANSSTGLAMNALSGVKTVARIAPKVGIVGAAVSVASLTASTMIDLYKHLLPSQFTRVQPTLTGTHYQNEDDGKKHELKQLKITVTSLKWDLSKTAADVVITTLGAVAAAKAIPADSTKFVKAFDKNATQYNSMYGANAVGQADYASNFCGTYLGSQCNSDTLSAGPYVWTVNFSVSDGGYYYFEPESSPASIEIDGLTKYKAVDDGLTVMLIAPRSDMFANKTKIKRVIFAVDKIAVYVSAPQTAIPGKQVCATVTKVSHALTQDIKWDLEDKFGTLLRTETTSGKAPHKFCFIMPTPSEDETTVTQSYEDCKSYSSGSYIVIATSTTDTGAREHNGNEPRLGTAAIFVEGEDDICEGLWVVTAREELNEFCTRDGFNQPDIQTIIDDLITSGGFDGLIDIQESSTKSYIMITDKLQNTTQRFNRIYTPLKVEIIYGDVDVTGVNADDTQTLNVPKLRRPPKQYSKIYSVPLPSVITEVEPLTLILTFTENDTFVATLSWMVSVQETFNGNKIDVVCDIDFIYDGVLNKKVESE